jgi:hypothetical protein
MSGVELIGPQVKFLQEGEKKKKKVAFSLSFPDLDFSTYLFLLPFCNMSRSNRKHQGSSRNFGKPSHHSNHQHRTHFKPRHGNHNNNNNIRRHHDQPTKPPVENIQTLPLPKGPLFERSQLTSRWKVARTIGPGFVNGQNTCFLNSVLECLTYTPSLAQYFLHKGHRKHCKFVFISAGWMSSFFDV